MCSTAPIFREILKNKKFSEFSYVTENVTMNEKVKKKSWRFGVTRPYSKIEKNSQKVRYGLIFFFFSEWLNYSDLEKSIYNGHHRSYGSQFFEFIFYF